MLSVELASGDDANWFKPSRDVVSLAPVAGVDLVSVAPVSGVDVVFLAQWIKPFL